MSWRPDPTMRRCRMPAVAVPRPKAGIRWPWGPTIGPPHTQVAVARPPRGGTCWPWDPTTGSYRTAEPPAHLPLGTGSTLHPTIRRWRSPPNSLPATPSSRPPSVPTPWLRRKPDGKRSSTLHTSHGSRTRRQVHRFHYQQRNANVVRFELHSSGPTRFAQAAHVSSRELSWRSRGAEVGERVTATGGIDHVNRERGYLERRRARPKAHCANPYLFSSRPSAKSALGSTMSRPHSAPGAHYEIRRERTFG
jgi:hypothetical protein